MRIRLANFGNIIALALSVFLLLGGSRPNNILSFDSVFLNIPILQSLVGSLLFLFLNSIFRNSKTLYANIIFYIALFAWAAIGFFSASRANIIVIIFSSISILLIVLSVKLKTKPTKRELELERISKLEREIEELKRGKN